MPLRGLIIGSRYNGAPTHPIPEGLLAFIPADTEQPPSEWSIWPNEKEIPDYPTIAESLPTTRTNTVHSYGMKGAGVKIAVLEGGTTTQPTTCFNIGAIQDSGAGANDHMTKSVAIIGNRYNGGACNGSWEGYAPSATVLIANKGDYVERYNWAKSKGANVITMSWHFPSEETDGDLHARDIYFDYVRTYAGVENRKNKGIESPWGGRLYA